MVRGVGSNPAASAIFSIFISSHDTGAVTRILTTTLTWLRQADNFLLRKLVIPLNTWAVSTNCGTCLKFFPTSLSAFSAAIDCVCERRQVRLRFYSRRIDTDLLWLWTRWESTRTQAGFYGDAAIDYIDSMYQFPHTVHSTSIECVAAG